MCKQEQVFRFIAILLPFAAGISIYTMPSQVLFDLFKVAIICDGSFYNKLIGFAFCIVLLAANLYAIGQGKKLELMLGSAYAVSTFLCLFAGDFLSLFIGLELMMLFSTAIIFIGGNTSSIRSAKKYFITHFISGSLILLGIVHIISKTKSLALVSAFALMSEPEYLSIIMSMMLVGMLINIAMFPFSGWMVNYYQTASPSGFIYLISFTTKLSILLLIKLFAGLSILKYLGVMMILHSGIKAIFENNMLKVLCHLSIMSMGLMLMAISVGSDIAITAVVCYLFIHILYKALLAICVASIIDTAGIHDCSTLKKINNNIIIIAAIIGVAMMIAMPATAAFQTKVAISHLFLGEIFYIVPVLLSLVMIYSLPWKNCLKSNESQTSLLGDYTKSSLILMSIVLTSVGLFGGKLLFLINNTSFDYASIFSSESLKQLIIIFLGLYLALKYKIKKLHTKSINLIDWFGELCFALYFRFLSRNDADMQASESWSIASLENQISRKLTAFHNQKTAIFIVFVFLMIVIAYAIKS
jgi:multicomponent Na+:H+ antiporter subunit D